MSPAPVVAAPDASEEAPLKPEEAQLPPVLDLDTIHPKRAVVLIDKEPYEIKLMGDYGVEEQHVITQDAAEYDRLWETPLAELGEDQGKRLKLLLDKLTEKALDAPKAVQKRLNDEQRKQIVQLFTSASVQSLQRALAHMVDEMVKQETARSSSTSES